MVTFTDLLNVIVKFYDGLESNKSEASVWGRRLHLAVQAYKELLINLTFMDKSEVESLQENTKIIKGNIFYTPEYRDTFLSLLKKFNMTIQTKSYLRDLIEAFHIFLKMLEKYCSGKTHIVVKKKKKASKKRKRNKLPAPVNLTSAEREEKWQELASDLSATLQGHAGDIPDSVVPFDAASEIPVDEQKTNALAQIQQFLRGHHSGEAVAMLRAARDVWPEDDHFGSVGISAEDEFMCLSGIFKMDLPSVLVTTEHEVGEMDEDETRPEDEEMAAVQTHEVEFSIQEFLNKLATPALLQPYCWLLKYYKENKDTTNHAIVKMLHRVAVDLKTPAMLFQLSLFCTFQKILFDPAANQYKEMVTFSRYIVSKFFDLLPKNPVLLAELVLWKSSGDCYEVVEGYGSLALRNASQSSSVWTFEEEEELRELYEEHKASDDLVDTILEKMSSDTKSKRQIMNKLVAMKLVASRKELTKKPPKKGVWPEKEIEQLRALYEEYKNSVEQEDIVEKMMEHMLNGSRTRRQVINQLVNLGLVEDRKMLRKKRTKGNKRKNQKNDGFLVDDDDEGGESEGGDAIEEGFDHPSFSEEESTTDGDDEKEADISEGSLNNIINKLTSAGLKEQLEWIQSKLLRTADDRESTDKEKWQPLPLVTITEENEEALGNKLFRQALKKVGLKPPASEQETFWRIPISLNSERLRMAAKDLEGTDTGDDEEAVNEDPVTPSAVSKSKSRKKALAALAAAARKNNGSASRRKRKERNRTGLENRRRGGKEWRKAMNDVAPDDNTGHDSDSDEDPGELKNTGDKEPRSPPPSGAQNSVNRKESSKRGKRRVRALDDSDEDDTELGRSLHNGQGESNENEDDKENKATNGNVTASDSENGDLEYSRNLSNTEDVSGNHSEVRRTEAGKKRARDDNGDGTSDDEDEKFNLPLNSHKKARRVVVDDDDEEE